MSAVVKHHPLVYLFAAAVSRFFRACIADPIAYLPLFQNQDKLSKRSFSFYIHRNL